MWRLKSTTTSFFFSFRILSIFNTHTHTQGEGRRFFKETYSDIYPKWPNSWIHNTGFKPLLLTLIFQCGINPLFFLLRILNIFNTHTWGERRRFLKKLTVCTPTNFQPYIWGKINQVKFYFSIHHTSFFFLR